MWMENPVIIAESIAARISEDGVLMVADPTTTGDFTVARVHNNQNQKQEGLGCTVSQLAVVRGRNDVTSIDHTAFSVNTDNREIKIHVS